MSHAVTQKTLSRSITHMLIESMTLPTKVVNYMTFAAAMSSEHE